MQDFLLGLKYFKEFADPYHRRKTKYFNLAFCY